MRRGVADHRGKAAAQQPKVTKSKRPRFRYILVRVSGPPIPRLGGDVVGAEVANSAHRVPGSDAKIIEADHNHAIIRVRRGTETAVRANLNRTVRLRDQEHLLRTVTTSGTLHALRDRGGLPPRPAQWKMRRRAERGKRGPGRR